MDKSNRSSFMMSPLKSSPNGSVAVDLLERPYLPECWSDDKRMDVLFNPFRIREINPEGWDLKMNFWINLINKWCLHERKAVFTIDELRRNFIRDLRMPHLDCIQLVMTHMRRQNKLLFKDEIVIPKNTKTSSSRLLSAPGSFANWAFNSLIIKPINYGWNFLSKDENLSASNEDKIMPIHQEYQLVNKETLEILADSVSAYIKTLDVSCMSFIKFVNLLNKKVFADKNVNETSLEVVLAYLETKNKIHIHEDAGFKIVKFGNDVKESDLTLVKLELTKEILEKEAGKLEEKIITLSRDARLAIQNDTKEKALFLLKKKKRLEKRLQDKDNQIDNIEILCAQLLESGSQQAILKAFQIANDFLKRNTTKVEDAETIMTQMDEVLNDVSNINAELNRPVGDMAQIELDAEKELEQLLEEMENEKTSESKTSIQNGESEKTTNNSEYPQDLLENMNRLTVLDDSTSSTKDSANKKSTEKIALTDNL